MSTQIDKYTMKMFLRYSHQIEQLWQAYRGCKSYGEFATEQLESFVQEECNGDAED